MTTNENLKKWDDKHVQELRKSMQDLVSEMEYLQFKLFHKNAEYKTIRSEYCKLLGLPEVNDARS